MRVITAPDESRDYGIALFEKTGFETPPTVFLAGTITGAQDWQSEIIQMLANDSGVLFNPRRENFPIDDPSAAPAQIKWEHDRLREAMLISFWFSPETLNPIVLYELGAWSMRTKPIVVGVHPDYARRQDVEIQTGLARPDVEIVYSLADLAVEIRKYL